MYTLAHPSHFRFSSPALWPTPGNNLLSDKVRR
jgi:hypothetical protein